MKKLTVWGILLTAVTGTLLHFAWKWSGYHFLVSLVAPVSESTWEHMKLLFFPMTAYILLTGKHWEPGSRRIYTAAFAGVLAGLAVIPLIFYTYTGFLGHSFLPVDILTYYVSVAAAYLVTAGLMKRSGSKNIPGWIGLAGFAVVAVLFFLFTYYPPKLEIFRNPLA